MFVLFKSPSVAGPEELQKACSVIITKADPYLLEKWD